MAKKKSYTLDEVKSLALSHLKKKHFGGLNPSDFTFNWTWGVINDGENQNPALEINGCKVLCYKHWEDLTEEEKHELKACNFLNRANS